MVRGGLWVGARAVDDSGAFVGVVTAEQRVVDQVGVKGGLELLGKVASSDPPPDVAVCFGEAWVAGASATTTVLEEFLTDAHRSPLCPRSARAARHLVNQPRDVTSEEDLP